MPKRSPNKLRADQTDSDQAGPGGSGMYVEATVGINHLYLYNNNSNAVLLTWHRTYADAQGATDIAAEGQNAAVEIKYNTSTVFTSTLGLSADMTYSSFFTPPPGIATFQTGGLFDIYARTYKVATNTLGYLAQTTAQVQPFFTACIPTTAGGLFTRASQSNAIMFLPPLSNYTTNVPLFIAKNISTTNDFIVSPWIGDSIDDTVDQMYQLQNTSRSGGALTLFPNATNNSWYVAMDYIGRMGSITNASYDQTWSNTNTCNWANATLGSMNVFNIGAAGPRSSIQNFINLPAPSNGKLTLVSYTGPDNCGLRSLAFSGQQIDNLPAYNPGTQNVAFDIIGQGQQRGAGAVFVSDSSRYYIIGHLTNPGDWWNNLITSRDLSQPNFTTGVLQNGCSVISNNINYQYKIYGPQFIASQTPNSCFSIIKVRNVVSGGDEDPMFVGHGPEYQTSSIFASSLQYIYKHFNQKSYECLWLGSESIDGNSRFAFYPINSYSADNTYF